MGTSTRKPGALDRIIEFSIKRRWTVVVLAALLMGLGVWESLRLQVDVFPEFTAPAVTVLTEASGMAPEEIEVLVTFPLESALNGAPGIRRVRSVSAAGLCVIWIEFDWGTEIYRARQMVSERLQGVPLPAGVSAPQMGPVSSIMGEITFVALTSSNQVNPMELRHYADMSVKRRLQAVPGVAQVVPIGGDVRRVDIRLDPATMNRHRLSLDGILEALQTADDTPAAGFYINNGQEYLVRGIGRFRSPKDLESVPIPTPDGGQIPLSLLADIDIKPAPQRGIASYRGKPAVILSVQKQPGANTLEVTQEIDKVLGELDKGLPKGIVLEKENFRQADFIRVAVSNVSAALRDGAILVVVILFLFLGGIRTTLISVMAIPLSLLGSLMALSWLGQSINTMTLGGLTIAIGALVDDAIIDVENVFRRLRQERDKPAELQRSAFQVVFEASSEVRRTIVFATIIIMMVFLPLFVLPGMEGRLLLPLGLSYVIALAVSLVVAMTVTPALCSILLPRSRSLGHRQAPLLRGILFLYQPILKWALKHRAVVLILSLGLLGWTLALVPYLGSRFLPPFNEGALTVAIVSFPGITLEDSDQLGRQVENALLKFPEVVSTSRRTGRAEKDEHVQGVNAAEMEVVLRPGRPKDELLAAMRQAVAAIPGVAVNFGQPISHRIDHMLSGVKTNLAIKIFGSDLAELRRLTRQVENILKANKEIADVSNQEQTAIPQLIAELDRRAIGRYGLTVQEVSHAVEAIFQGTVAGQIVENGAVLEVVVNLAEGTRANRDALAKLPVASTEGRLVSLAEVAHLRFDAGPSLIRRENVQRVAVISANVVGRDLTGTVDSLKRELAAKVPLPPGYSIVYGGQFEEAVSSFQIIRNLSLLILVAVYLILYFAFKKHKHAIIILVNLPLAMIGGILAVYLGDGVLSLASIIGFVTLLGIATRNGMLLVNEYRLRLKKGADSVEEVVLAGSCERLAPVLMTALTASLALIPLVIAGNRPGNEIQSPMAVVILGGLLTSTLLNMVLVPVLFSRWGMKLHPEDAAEASLDQGEIHA